MILRVLDPVLQREQGPSRLGHGNRREADRRAGTRLRQAPDVGAAGHARSSRNRPVGWRSAMRTIGLPSPATWIAPSATAIRHDVEIARVRQRRPVELVGHAVGRLGQGEARGEEGLDRRLREIIVLRAEDHADRRLRRAPATVPRSPTSSASPLRLQGRDRIARPQCPTLQAAEPGSGVRGRGYAIDRWERVRASRQGADGENAPADRTRAKSRSPGFNGHARGGGWQAACRRATRRSRPPAKARDTGASVVSDMTARPDLDRRRVRCGLPSARLAVSRC